MKISINKIFDTRDDLDKYVRSTFGEDPTANADVSLELSADEMSSLALDETTLVHGVRVTATDSEEVLEKPTPLVRAQLGGKKRKPKVVRKKK